MLSVGIIGAMDEEISYFLEKVSLDTIEEKANLKFYIGKWNKIVLFIVKSGIGKVNAALCTQILISEYHVTKIVNTGIAGGTDLSLDLFDFVVSTDAIQHDIDVSAFGYTVGTIPGIPSSVFTADKKLISLAVSSHKMGNFHNKILQGRIASGDIFITNGTHKDDICSSFHPACVEMEGAAIAHVCTVNNVPFVILRCISDLADKKTEDGFEQKAASLSSQLILKMISGMEE